MNKLGVKSRAFLLAFIPMLFITGILSFYFINGQLTDIDRSINNHGKSVARHLAHASEYGVFSGNQESLEILLRSSMKEEDVISLKITDKMDEVLAYASNSSSKNSQLKPVNLSNNRIFRHPIILLTTPAFDIMEFTNSDRIEEKNELLGWVISEISTDRLKERQSTIIWDSMVIIFIGMIISMLLATWIARGLTGPISRLTSSVRDIERGNLNTNIDNISSGEIGDLENGVRSMLGKVRFNQHELQNKIDESTSVLKSSLSLLEEQNKELSDAREKAMLANKTKSRFLANMSHEIRTPMNGILGFVRLLMSSNLSKDQKEYLETIDKSANDLLSLIDDILDLSKVEAGKIRINDTLFNIEKCVEDAVMLMAPAAQEKGLVITNLHYSDTPIEIQAPRDRISQILINYIGNAIKFSDNGTIVIRTMLAPNDDKPDSIMISVTDQGIGIPEEEIDLMFSPFSQIDDTSTRQYGGTGLGLAISKSLAEAMGGEVGAESKPGEGSTFWFTFCCKSTISQDSPHKDQAVYQNKTVFLYDLNEFTRHNISANLIQTGLTVSAFPKLDNLVSKLKNAEHCDICALSLSYEEMDDEFVRGIINTIRKSTDTKILLFSCLTDAMHNTNSNDHCADICISKPYRKNDLLMSLNKLISIDTDIIGKKTINYSLNNANTNTAQKNEKNIKGCYILIAEDNAINTKLLQTILEQEGAKTIHATNGEQAVKLFLNHPIDIILMDVHMPIMNGIDATKQIRDYEDNISHTPIIGLTANAINEDIVSFKSSGMDDLLIKPVAIDDLLHEIKFWINKSDGYSQNILNTSENRNDILNGTISIDRKAHGHLGINKKLVSSLREMLISELPNTKNQLCDHFSSKNWDMLREQIHKLLGGIAYCDLPELQGAALSFQKSLKEQSDSLEDDFKRLLFEIDTLI